MSDQDAGLPQLIETVFGRWKSQIIYLGVKLGIFDALEDGPASSADLARMLTLDPANTERLIGALASLSLLHRDRGVYRLSDQGRFLCAGSVPSLRSMVLLEEGMVHYSIWRHLEEIIRTGTGTGFELEFGTPIWRYLQENQDYSNIFHAAMSSYSTTEAGAIAAALKLEALAPGTRICDVGGGDGVLLQSVLKRFADSNGILFDLPETVATAKDRGDSPESDRLVRVGGNMFESVPEADVYFLKHILHDWNDEECRDILTTIRRASAPNARVVVCEFVLPEEPRATFASLIDIHMMCVSTGRQRRFSELKDLLASTGWNHADITDVEGTPIQIVIAG